MRSAVVTRSAQLIVALWAGSLCTICGLVAPTLFSELPDRHLAGRLAAHFFSLSAWAGLGLGTVTAIALARAGSVADKIDYALLISAVVAPLASELLLHAPMEAARLAGNMTRFGMLHGVSALLYVVAAACLLWLAWRLTAARIES